MDSSVPAAGPRNLDAFWNETAKGLANVLVKVETEWYGRDSADYTEERLNLEKYSRCWKYGLAATAFLFVNFRVTGSKPFRAWRENFVNKKGWVLNASKWKKLNCTKGNMSHHQHYQPGYLEKKREEDVAKAMESMKVITDLLVSISVGTSGAIFLIHAEKDNMRKDFENAPLVGGRSVVSDEMCANMTMLANTQDFPRQPAGTSTDPNWETFRRFISNCKRRADYELKFRTLSGRLQHEPVVIPHDVFSKDSNRDMN